MIDLIGDEPEKMHIYSGHPEIELALYKLYRYTNEERFLLFMKYLILARGQQPSFLKSDSGFGYIYHDQWFDLSYHQAHQPVVEQREAVGHSVRAVYLYSAMADLAYETNDAELKNALDELWKDVVERKIYITGSIGAEEHGECFSTAYDLPNDRAYAETCAAIGLFFWAYRMFNLDHCSKYMDIAEIIMYNGALSGMSDDGKRYFYVNPLEVKPSEAHARYDMRHVEVERQTWMGCACCPPNIARLISSLDNYVACFDKCENALYVNQFVGGQIEFLKDSEKFVFHVESSYLQDGKVRLKYSGRPCDLQLYIRIPGWCKEFSTNLENVSEAYGKRNGYLWIHKTFLENECIEICFQMPARLVYANPKVRADAGKVAVMRGPVVYCFEEADNGSDLCALKLKPFDPSTVKAYPDPSISNGAIVIDIQGYREVPDTDELYRDKPAEVQEVELKAIPYYWWGNRTVGEMCVWMRT